MRSKSYTLCHLEGTGPFVPLPEVNFHVHDVLRVLESERDLALVLARNDVLSARPPGLDVLLADAVVGQTRQAAVLSAAGIAAVRSGALVPTGGGHGDGCLGPGLDGPLLIADRGRCIADVLCTECRKEQKNIS